MHFFFQGAFNFCEAFSGEKKPGDERFIKGQELLAKLTEENTFCESDMFTVLRDKKSGICRTCDNPFPTQGSQVSKKEKYFSIEVQNLLRFVTHYENFDFRDPLVKSKQE